MREPGQLLASGRDADIFECGPGLVLRRSRQRRSLADEARIMAFLHEQGYPVPAVEEISADGVDLVMERIDGPAMADAMARRPWTLRSNATMLADLHKHLHEIAAPSFLGNVEVGVGDRVVHMDLHPLNVIIGPRGPVVIDWARAGRGDPAADVVSAWLLMATAAVAASGLKAAVIRYGRSQLTREFLGHFDMGPLAACVHEVVEWKSEDGNMSGAEIAAMRRLADRTTARD